VADSVLATLEPERLYGVWWYGRETIKTWRESGTYRKRRKVIQNDPSSWLAVPVPDIGVPRVVVDAARASIKDNVRSSRAAGRVWELDSGIFRCGTCGWRLAPRTSGLTNSQGSYVCTSYTRRDKRHGAPNFFHAAKTEAEVARRVDAYFDDPDKMTRYIGERLEQERSRLFAGDADAHTKALTQMLAKLETMREKLSEQHLHGVITIAKLKEKLASLDEQEQEARSELDALADRQGHMKHLEQEAKYVLDFFAATVSAEGLESLSPEARREMYKRMNLKVIANPDRTLTIEAIPDTNYLPVVEAARKEVSQVRTYNQS
jgi:hypothetical protein